MRLVETGVDGSSRSVDVMAIDCPGDLGDIAALGLTLAQGKQLVALVQQAIVTAQSRDHAVRWPECRTTVKLHLGHVADVLHCHAHALFGWDVPVDVADLSWALLP